MEKYLGVKLIEAEVIDGNIAHLSGLKKAGAEVGYKVVYEDGYTSWSPKDVFEKAYRRIDRLTFGLAIEALKQGKKVARNGWNGKNMYLYYVPANSYISVTEIAKKEFGETVDSGAYIAMKPASGPLVIGWLASQTDILSEDWCIID